MPLVTAEEATQILRGGRLLVLWDEAQEMGAVCAAAEVATPEHINFMARHARGLVAVPMEGRRLDELQLPAMVANSTAQFGAAYTISVDATKGITTGISAYDRATTVRTLISPGTRPEDLARPGHVFPIRCVAGGVLVQPSLPEASLDLAKLAGLYPATVLCGIMHADGSMAKGPELQEFASQHQLKLLAIGLLVEHRRCYDRLVERVAEARLPTPYGEFTAMAYKGLIDQDEYVVLVMGQPAGNGPLLAVLHQECIIGEVLGSRGCGCWEVVEGGLQAIGQAGRGVLIYAPSKLATTHLPSAASDSRREPRPGWYLAMARQVLRDLGVVGQVRLLVEGVAQELELEHPPAPLPRTAPY